MRVPDWEEEVPFEGVPQGLGMESVYVFGARGRPLPPLRRTSPRPFPNGGLGLILGCETCASLLPFAGERLSPVNVRRVFSDPVLSHAGLPTPMASPPEWRTRYRPREGAPRPFVLRTS